MKRKYFELFIPMLVFILAVCLISCSSNNNKYITSLEQAKSGSYTVGALSMTYCEEMIPNEFPNAKRVEIYNDPTAAYEALSAGKIDIFIQDSTMCRIELGKGIKGLKVINERVGDYQEVAAGVSPKSSVVSKELIDTILQNYEKDGTLQDMKTRWINGSNYEMPQIQEVKDSSKKVLKVCTSGVVEPFSFYQNNELTGYEIELAYRIAKELDLRLEIEVNNNYSSLISSIETGKNDLLLANLYCTEERKRQIPLSYSYYNTYAIIVVKNDYSVDDINTLDDLYNKKIGFEKDSIQFDSQISKYLPNSEKVQYNSQADCLVALKNFRIDGIIEDLPVAEYIVRNDSSVKILSEHLDEDNYGFVFNKGSSYVSEFNNIIEKYLKDGTIENLKDKWFNTKNDRKLTESTVLNPKAKLRCVTTATLEPMSYISNNQVVGFEVDLLILIGNELNYEIEILEPQSSIGSVFMALSTNKADLSFNTFSITEERKQSYDFTIPYYCGAAVVVVRNTQAEETNFFRSLGNSFYKTFVKEQRWKMILDGTLITLIMSFTSGIIGIILGLAFCSLKKVNFKPLLKTFKFINKLIQGTPIIVFLMIMYYVVFRAIDIKAIYVAILAFGINFGVFASEIMKSGFDSVDKGQIEAATAMGYSKIQVFFKITLPQASSKFLPVLRQEFISMVKMTSVAGYISVQELTRVGDIIRSRTMEAFFPLIVIALIYFGLSELLAFSLTLLEKKLDTKKKPFKMKGVTIHE